MSSKGTIGHSHVSEAPASQTNTVADNSSGSSPSQGLHVLIAQTAARVPSTMTTPTTPGHGHGAKFVLPHAEARLPGTDDIVPGHGHGARFVIPSSSESASSPVQPRPSARVARRGSLYTTADEEQTEQENATLGHPLFDLAQNGTLPSTMEAEEPPSAEIDGHFDQPAHGQGDVSGSEDGSSRPLGGA